MSWVQQGFRGRREFTKVLRRFECRGFTGFRVLRVEGLQWRVSRAFRVLSVESLHEGFLLMAADPIMI